MNPARTLAGRYRLEQQLGGGGTAVVHRARDLPEDRPVAVKELRPQFASLAPARRRFLREAAIARWLTHPGIVRLLDSDQDGPSVFLVMELIEGETLRQLLDRLGALGPEVARRITIRLAEVLAYAHGQGVIHRDLKPENVFITGAPAPDVEALYADVELGDRIKLGDFGQARVTALASLTGTSVTWGTPEYMAPEAFVRGQLDPRGDLYSLGVIFHELCTGRLPWPRVQALSRLGSAIKGAAVTLPATGAGPEADAVLASLLASLPEQRPPSGLTVAARLRDLQAALPAPPGKCLGCGATLPAAMPLCLSCGQQVVRVAHSPQGAWKLVLRSLQDDAAETGTLLELLATLCESPPGRLLFLIGDKNLYSKGEQERAIRLPTVLFDRLDEPTARALEVLFRSRGLSVEATSNRSIAFSRDLRKTFLSSGTASGAVGIAAATAMLIGVSGNVLVSLAVGGGLLTATLTGVVAHQRRKLRTQPGRFRLGGHAVAVPAADALLAEATAALARVRLPQVRALFADLAASLYRLARHAETRLHQGQAPDAARRVLDAAPEIGRRIAALADRLETVDGALAESGEGELLQSLGRLERRLSTPGEDPGLDRAALVSTRHRLEETLAHRHQLEEERDQLAGTLCALLGRLRAACQDAEALVIGAAEQEAHTLDAAMAELDSFLTVRR